MAWNFAGGSLSGTIEFTLPATTYAGTAGTGGLNYVIEANDMVIKSESASWGERMSVPVAFDTPAWDVMFDSEAATGGFTAIDANHDGFTWSWSESDMAYRTYFNRAKDNDDWLVTPALRLEAGKVYEFTAAMHSLHDALRGVLPPRTRHNADAPGKHRIGNVERLYG
ncbi:MAG: hypothetical protein NC204_06370 [Candidatus Amulumruptor caecigallinarius]|nr:hypothetical protein [Candidatus Amulumruptor caecigallinarius]